MTEDGVLVDTSVLIDFLKNTEPNAKAVAALISSKQICTTGIIMAELLQGIRNAGEESVVDALVNGIPAVEVTTALWVKAGMLSSALRRKGITLPLSDIAVAVVAIEHNLTIFTLDRHFADIPGVKLYKPAQAIS